MTEMQTRTNVADADGTSVSSHVDEFELEGKESNSSEIDTQELNLQSDDASSGNENVYNIREEGFMGDSRSIKQEGGLK